MLKLILGEVGVVRSFQTIPTLPKFPPTYIVSYRLSIFTYHPEIGTDQGALAENDAKFNYSCGPSPGTRG